MIEPLRCTDGCGAAVANEDEAQAKGWNRLQITGRYRCPTCMRALDTVNAPPAQLIPNEMLDGSGMGRLPGYP